MIEACLVCVNKEGVNGAACGLRGSEEYVQALKDRLAARGSNVPVEPKVCFSACEDGPNIVLCPDGPWYSHVQPTDLDEIADNIAGGPKVDRLINNVDPALQDLIITVAMSMRESP